MDWSKATARRDDKYFSLFSTFYIKGVTLLQNIAISITEKICKLDNLNSNRNIHDWSITHKVNPYSIHGWLPDSFTICEYNFCKNPSQRLLSWEKSNCATWNNYMEKRETRICYFKVVCIGVNAYSFILCGKTNLTFKMNLKECTKFTALP